MDDALSASEPSDGEADGQGDAVEHDDASAADPFYAISVDALYSSPRYQTKVTGRAGVVELVTLDKDVRARELCGLLLHEIDRVGTELAGVGQPTSEAPW